jgi:hypothetical protein
MLGNLVHVRLCTLITTYATGEPYLAEYHESLRVSISQYEDLVPPFVVKASSCQRVIKVIAKLLRGYKTPVAGHRHGYQRTLARR